MKIVRSVSMDEEVMGALDEYVNSVPYTKSLIVTTAVSEFLALSESERETILKEAYKSKG